MNQFLIYLNPVIIFLPCNVVKEKLILAGRGGGAFLKMSPLTWERLFDSRVDRPQSQLDSNLRNLTAKLDWLLQSKTGGQRFFKCSW